MRFPRQTTEEVSINLTPLIDVVFLLLIFFMVSTTFSRETRLQIDLPQASDAAQARYEGIEVTIDAQGHFSVNDQLLVNSQPKTLHAALLKFSEGEFNQPLRISADGVTPHQSVVTAMDVAGALGFKQLSITTRAGE